MGSMASADFCTYCHVERATDGEHVFPKSWYPDNTPNTVQRLTVPSCRACNLRWQQVEESVGHDLLMVCDAEHPDTAGVVNRIMNGWDASRARSERDAKHRQGRVQRILKTIKWEKAHREASQVEAQLADGTTVLVSPAREIDPTALSALAEKFIRGLHYAEGRGDVPLDHIVRAVIVPSPGLKEVPRDASAAFPETVVQVANGLRMNDRLKPGFLYGWAKVKDGSIWSFRLWGHVMIVAACTPRLIIPATR